MSAGVMTLHVGDEVVGHVIHSGTSDITRSTVYATSEDAWAARSHSGDDAWLKCECGKDPTKTTAKGQYGEWSIWICRDCRAVVHCPASDETSLGNMSNWLDADDPVMVEVRKRLERFRE